MNHSKRTYIKSINFDDEEINKINFYKNKRQNIYEIDLDKILVSKKNLIVKKSH